MMVSRVHISFFLLIWVYLINYSVPVAASLQAGNEAFMSGDFAEARILWSQSDNPHPQSLHNLGMLYSQRIGVPKELDRAASFFYQAAIQGYAPSQYWYALNLLNQTEDQINSSEIIFWLKNADAQGFAAASYELGKQYVDGLHTEKNLPLAISYLQKAVDANISEAERLLSTIEIDLPGVTKNSDETQITARLTEGRGTLAQRKLFYKGQKAFIRQDYDIAVQHWAPLAEQGMAKAQYGIAFMLESGWGVVQDFKEAAYWYKLSAQKGHRKAQFNLGRMYVDGRGIEQNEGIGYYWIQSAADLGEERAIEFMRKLQ